MATTLTNDYCSNLPSFFHRQLNELQHEKWKVFSNKALRSLSLSALLYNRLNARELGSYIRHCNRLQIRRGVAKTAFIYLHTTGMLLAAYTHS